MRNASWMSIAAGLVLLAGCRDQDTSANRIAPGGSATRTTGGSSDFATPRRPETGVDPAKRAQDQANAANKEAASASKDVLNAQEKLREDEQKMGRTQQKDEQKLGEAQRKEASARDGAQAAQGAAQQTVNGTVAQASSEEVRVDSANQPGLRLKLNESTRITVDGKEASAAQLREGAQVRASYSVIGDRPTALRIEAKSAKKP